MVRLKNTINTVFKIILGISSTIRFNIRFKIRLNIVFEDWINYQIAAYLEDCIEY